MAAARLPTCAELAGARVLEISAGTGLLAIAAAACGADVLVTDIAQQVPLIKANAAANERIVAAGGGRVEVGIHAWGDVDGAFSSAPGGGDGGDGTAARARYRLGICSEALYIAIREGRVEELLRSLAAMVAACDVVVFGFQERALEAEDAVLARVGEGASVTRLGEGALDFRDACIPPLVDCDDGDNVVPLFYEHPPVRLYLLTRARGSGAGGDA